MNGDYKSLWIKPEYDKADYKRAGIKRTCSSMGKETAGELHESYGHISYNTLRKRRSDTRLVNKGRPRNRHHSNGAKSSEPTGY